MDVMKDESLCLVIVVVGIGTNVGSVVKRSVVVLVVPLGLSLISRRRWCLLMWRVDGRALLALVPSFVS